MLYTTLGKTSLVIFRLDLGTMTFGPNVAFRGFTPTVDEEVETLDAGPHPSHCYPYGFITRGGDYAVRQALHG